MSRRGATREPRLREQERGPPARRLHAAVGDLRHFLVDRHGSSDARELARLVDRAEKIAEVIECHNGGRKSRRSVARTRRARNRRRGVAPTALPARGTRAPTLAGRYTHPYVSTRAGRWRAECAESKRGTARAVARSAAS